jgi:hypothetical protein
MGVLSKYSVNELSDRNVDKIFFCNLLVEYRIGPTREGTALPLFSIHIGHFRKKPSQMTKTIADLARNDKTFVKTFAKIFTVFVTFRNFYAKSE